MGHEPDLVPSGEQSAQGLLEDWPPYDPVFDPIDRVFLPRADIATETLVAGLVELGWEVDDVTAYRTVRAAPPPAETREAIKGGGFDAVLFTSSSTVRNLVGIAGKPHTSTVIACIGPQTAKTAEEHGLRVDVLASTASTSSLVGGAGRVRRGAATGARWRPASRAARPLAAAGTGPAQGDSRARDRLSARSGRAGCVVPRPCGGWSPRPGSSRADLVLPLFVREGAGEPRADLVDARRRPAHPRLAAQGGVEAVDAGVGGLMLFGVPSVARTRSAAAGTDPDGILQRRCGRSWPRSATRRS